jgi:signal transduction histidine kinase
MNTLFNKLTLSAKLAIVGFVPLICLLFVSYYFNAEKTERIVIVQNFGKRVQETAALTRLVDMLQAERRYSHAFVLNGMAGNEMIQARAESEKSFQELETLSSERLGETRAYTMVDLLPELRSRIDRQELSTSEVMDVYTKMILRLNVLSVMSTQNIPYLERLNADLRGQRILSQMITYLGIIRSGVYEILFLKNKDPEARALLKNNFYYFLSLEKEFFLKASSSAINRYSQLKKTRDVKAMFDLLSTLEQGNVLAEKHTAPEWWQLSAVAVDQIKQLQRNILAEVQRKTVNVLRVEEQTRNRNLVVLILNVIAVLLVVMLVLTNIRRLLASLKESAELIALGQSGSSLRITTRDAIGKLAESIHFIDINNVQLAQTAAEIGKGNFDVEVEPRSDNDMLGNAIVNMKNDLQAFRRENEKKIWIQNGISLINDSVRGEKNVSDLTDSSLSALADYLKVQAALYYVAENNILYFSAGYAVSNSEVVTRSFNVGETLAGQAAKDKQIKVLSDVPASYVKISSATGDAAPRQITIIPLIHNDMLEGVIELASLKPLGAADMDLIKAATPVLAISLQVGQNRTKLKELLEETQAQSEELQSQHSELENLNAELEMQSQKLQASEEELRVQQEELQQTNEELEERSSLLEEKNVEIRRKAEELEQTTKYKSEFLANVSHELRTPLNSILLLSRLLKENHDKNLNDEQIEYARVIQNSGSGLLALIDEILDLSKIEAGKMQLEYLPVGAKEIVNDMESLFRVVANEKGLDLEMVIAPDVPSPIVTDKTRLEQILKNLLSNALKFTAKGSVKLTVSKHVKDPTMVSFSVTDTGIGIAKEKQPLVFEAFQQADGSTKRKFGGTGLGLSISRELARLLGGDIILHSEPGKGSSFTVNVPVKGEENMKGLPQTEQSVTIQNPDDPQAKFRTTVIPENIPDDREKINENDKVILIIEDDTISRNHYSITPGKRDTRVW